MSGYNQKDVAKFEKARKKHCAVHGHSMHCLEERQNGYSDKQEKYKKLRLFGGKEHDEATTEVLDTCCGAG